MTKTVSDPVTVMKRHEIKYLLDAQKTAYLRARLVGHMVPDAFGLTSIASLYYDTPDRRLIRASLEKPPFKEKLRLRSYGLAEDGSPVYLELKCKAFDTVYKRRVQSTLDGVQQFFEGGAPLGDGGQIAREIRAFCDLYDTLSPSCLIIYDRTAYFEPDGELRLTIDENRSCRKAGRFWRSRCRTRSRSGWPRSSQAGKSTAAAFPNTARPTAVKSKSAPFDR